MTWTYNETLPADKDKVRMLCGDVDEGDQQITNEAILFHIAAEANLYAAAAACCRTIAAGYARRVDFSNAGLSLAASQRMRHYQDMAKTLAARGAAGGVSGIGSPYVGGVSIADLNVDRADDDVLPGRMRHDLHEQDGEPAAPEIDE